MTTSLCDRCMPSGRKRLLTSPGTPHDKSLDRWAPNHVSARMYLLRDHLSTLAPLLTEFVQSGELG